MKLFARKPIAKLLSEASESGEHSLQRHLGPVNLIMLGIGAIIGAGLFVRTAAAASQHAGPGVTISFLIAALGCAFAGMCYAEFAAMTPIAGSAYTYSYATLGEFFAWIIGWDLVLEYALGAATVAIAWSEYFNKLLETFFNLKVPYEWCHSPWQTQLGDDGTVIAQGIMNIPAVFILLLLTFALVRGIQTSAVLNAIIVVVKVTIVLLFIALGWQFIQPENLTPLIPESTTFTSGNTEQAFGGWSGILTGAGVVFFAFIGFDAVSTAAQETKNPERNMPIGILGSLVVCTILYMLFSYVLVGIAPYTEFRGAGSEASVAFAISKYMVGYGWFSNFVTIAILFGFSSVILVMLLGQSRVFYSMSKDGLVPKIFSDVHPTYRTPWKSNWLFFVFVSLFAAFIPGDVVGDMTSIGTLFAFVLVSVGVIVMRKRDPETPRPFRTPWVPIIPLLGAGFCLLMIVSLEMENWLRLLVWLAIGCVIYFGYSIRHSRVQNEPESAS